MSNINHNELRRQGMSAAVNLIHGGKSLNDLDELCRKHKTISTHRVMHHLEESGDFMRDCAYVMRKLIDELTNQIVLAEELEGQRDAALGKPAKENASYQYTREYGRIYAQGERQSAKCGEF